MKKRVMLSICTIMLAMSGCGKKQEVIEETVYDGDIPAEEPAETPAVKEEMTVKTINPFEDVKGHFEYVINKDLEMIETFVIDEVPEYEGLHLTFKTYVEHPGYLYLFADETELDRSMYIIEGYDVHQEGWYYYKNISDLGPKRVYRDAFNIELWTDSERVLDLVREAAHKHMNYIMETNPIIETEDDRILQIVDYRIEEEPDENVSIFGEANGIYSSSMDICVPAYVIDEEGEEHNLAPLRFGIYKYGFDSFEAIPTEIGFDTYVGPKVITTTTRGEFRTASYDIPEEYRIDNYKKDPGKEIPFSPVTIRRINTECDWGKIMHVFEDHDNESREIDVVDYGEEVTVDKSFYDNVYVWLYICDSRRKTGVDPYGNLMTEIKDGWIRVAEDGYYMIMDDSVKPYTIRSNWAQEQ